MELGYTLSSEEHPGSRLVELARRAEQAGFTFASISDHYHPWIDRQGNSPFAWSVLGGVAQATERLELMTGVTCPTMRIHPAIVAQAAATVAEMMPGRFTLGLGTGEALNEHILGDPWPSPEVRLEMLEEAIEVIRSLWEGQVLTFHGAYYDVERARLYTLPPEPPLIVVAASGPASATLAASVADGILTTTPDPRLLERYRLAGGAGRIYGQLHVCWAETVAEARRTAKEWWPTAGLPGALGTELPLPRHFEQAAQLVTEEDLARSVVCDPDPAAHLEAIGRFAGAGFERLSIHQVGPDQEGFFRFYEAEVLPRAGSVAASADGRARGAGRVEDPRLTGES
ncbi:MAG TPA: TIGR03557 family F420-dependent LLM class oxidoreductase [Actinomycetota bacterium]|nr:TIGR03557 family F420-dependent LLM class oxidoreductase [Actinomycetota bacterium]